MLLMTSFASLSLHGLSKPPRPILNKSKMWIHFHISISRILVRLSIITWTRRIRRPHRWPWGRGRGRRPWQRDGSAPGRSADFVEKIAIDNLNYHFLWEQHVTDSKIFCKHRKKKMSQISRAIQKNEKKFFFKKKMPNHHGTHFWQTETATSFLVKI